MFSQAVNQRRSFFPLVPTVAPSVSGHGYNLPYFGYYGGAYPFIDVMKSGSPGWQGSPGPIDADEFLTALPAGNTATRTICLDQDDNFGWFPPGNYKVTSSSAATLSVQSNTYISGATTGVGSITFTVTAPAAGAWSGLVIRLDVKNNTGSAIAVNNLKMFLVSEETLLNSGEIFKPGFLSEYANSACVRWLDWFGNNGEEAFTYRTFADIGTQNEGKLSYSYDNNGYGITSRMPVTIPAKLAQKLGAALWVTLPGACGVHYYKTTFATSRISAILHAADTTVVPHGYSEGEQITCFAGFGSVHCSGIGSVDQQVPIFAKNVTTNDFQVSLTSGGAAVTFTRPAAMNATLNTGNNTLTGIASTASLYAGMPVSGTGIPANTKIGSVVNGTSVTIVDLGDGNVNPTVGGTQSIQFGGDWLPSNLNYARFGSLTIDILNATWKPLFAAIYAACPSINIYTEALNECWNTGFDAYAFTQRLASIRGGNSGDLGTGYAWLELQAWAAAIAAYPSAQVTRVITCQTANYFGMSPQLTFVDPGFISAGQTIKQIINANPSQYVWALAPYVNPAVNVGDQAPTCSADVVWAANGNSAAVPDAYWDSKYNNGITDASNWMSSVTASVLAQLPSIRFVCYEWGNQYYSGGGVHVTPIALNLAAYLDSAAGRDMYIRAYNSNLAPYNMKLINHYYGSGNYGTRFLWGIKQQQTAATPRWTWFQTL